MEKLKKKVSSIKISLILSFTFTLIISQLIYYSINKLIIHFSLNLLDPRPVDIVNSGKRTVFIYNNVVPDDYNSTILNPDLFSMLQQIRAYLPILVFGICIIITSILFYNIKLKYPLLELSYSIQKIEQNNLDFCLQTNLNNELGDICRAFEHMRQSLSSTFQKLWKTEDKQKYLYQAFAHDLRTPLSIIKGNNEIVHILGAKDINQIKRCIQFSDTAIERIESYMNNLKELQNIEHIILSFRKINSKYLETILQNQINILSKKYNKKAVIINNLSTDLFIDDKLILRVLDNLIQNAFRFANSKVQISMNIFEDMLEFCVCDDGDGFNNQSLAHATEAFYSSDKSRGHTGLGLTIAENLLQLYQTKLEISNQNPYGALIKFKIFLKV